MIQALKEKEKIHQSIRQIEKFNVKIPVPTGISEGNQEFQCAISFHTTPNVNLDYVVKEAQAQIGQIILILEQARLLVHPVVLTSIELKKKQALNEINELVRNTSTSSANDSSQIDSKNIQER